MAIAVLAPLTVEISTLATRSPESVTVAVDRDANAPVESAVMVAVVGSEVVNVISPVTTVLSPLPSVLAEVLAVVPSVLRARTSKSAVVLFCAVILFYTCWVSAVESLII